MWTVSFWKQAAERAIKSAAGVAFAAIGLDGSNVADGFDIRATLWLVLGSVVASLLFSVMTSGVGEPGSPSAVAVTEAPTKGSPVHWEDRGDVQGH